MTGVAGAEREAWIALASVPGVGELTFGRLLARHGSAGAALEAVARLRASEADRTLADALGQPLRRGLAAAIRLAANDPPATSRAMAGLGGWLVTPFDPAYPLRLHDLEWPPPVLFGIGDPASLDCGPVIAVVGTRRATVAGRDLAARIATRLAEVGATVISGLALGIDAAAHRAAIEAGGRTVAVLGGGLDEPSPTVHRQLAGRIARDGSLVSEMPPGARPTQGTFPRRNRIISVLASATIVVEAPARSGALITARHALEQGRRLLVAPGRPLDPCVAGCLALLRESPALPLVGLDEMLVDLELDEGARSPGTTATPGGLTLAGALAQLGPHERAVASALHGAPRTVDQLCAATGQPAGVVAAALTLLQLRGWARVHGSVQLPAGPLLRVDADGPA